MLPKSLMTYFYNTEPIYMYAPTFCFSVNASGAFTKHSKELRKFFTKKIIQ